MPSCKAHISSEMDVPSKKSGHRVISSSDRTIQPPVSVATEMWTNHVLQWTDPHSNSSPPFPPAQLP